MFLGRIFKTRKNKKYFSTLIIFILVLLLFGVFAIEQINKFSSIFDIFNKKVEPKIVYKAEDTVKILEGWTNQDIVIYLVNQEKWNKTEILNITDSASSTNFFAKQYSFLTDQEDSTSLEGYLFPDTYRIYSSSTVKELVIKMLNNFDHKLTAQMRNDIKSQGKTISQIVIMASIIEKEAPFYGENNDAKIVSGIFWNRIKSGQALQSDATLSYIFKDNKPSHEGNDLNNPSLYNTYKYRGLPPGPICNPGLLALEAAIYPTKTDYNYFLTSPEGHIYYAKTYAAHLQNKNKYLK